MSSACSEKRDRSSFRHGTRVGVRGQKRRSRGAIGMRTGTVWRTHFLISGRNRERTSIMSHKQQYEANDLEYLVNEFKETERLDSSNRHRPAMGRKRGKVPQSFNGIHRRRKRKMAW